MLNLNYQNIKAFIHKNYLNFKILCSTFPKIQSYNSLTSGAQQTFIFICESDFSTFAPTGSFFCGARSGGISPLIYIHQPLNLLGFTLKAENTRLIIGQTKKTIKIQKNVTWGKYIRLVLTVLYQVPEVCLTADGPLYRYTHTQLQ